MTQEMAGIYLAELDAITREDLRLLYEANRNCPVKLRAAFDAMRADYLEQHVFPEIHARWLLGFERMAAAYLSERGRRRAAQPIVRRRCSTSRNIR